jgi:hypothetical protein
MKYAFFLLAVASLHAQTAFSTRVDIKSNSAKTVGGELRVYNSTNTLYGSYKSDYAGVEATNYLVELYATASGIKVWYKGLSGARATLIPGGAAGVGQLTLCDQTIANCTGWKSSTSASASVVYEMPPADGTSGDCLSTNGSGILSWLSCSGGGSTPPFVDTTNIIKGSADATKLLKFEVDGLTTGTTRTWTAQDANITVAGIDLAQTWTATQTVRDVRPSVNDTYRLGDDTTPLRWYELNANRINGVCTVLFTCSQSNNYVNTRKLNLYDMSGGTNNSWDMRTNANSPTTSYYEIRDQAGTAFLTLTRQFASVTVNNATLDGNLLPSADATYALGSASSRWTGLTLSDLSGSGTVCVKTDTNGTLGKASGACALDPTTTTGDMIYRNSGGNLARLAIGASDGYCLVVSSGLPAWTSYGCNPITTRGDMVVGSALGTPGRLPVGTVDQVLTVSCPLGNCTPTWSTFSGTSPISYSSGTISCATCVTTSRTVSTSSPLGGGGALSSNLTLTCSTCVTTAGGQSISGTTTLSTASISTAISGTFNLSGNMTVTGNLYLRTYSGGSANCSGVADGWVGVRTDTGGTSGMPQIEICVGSATMYVGLN